MARSAGARVLFFLDGEERARGVLHQPPIAEGRGGTKAQNRDRRAFRERAPQGLHRLRSDERRIREKDQKIVMAVGQRLARGEHRMSGAAPLLLHENPRLGPGALGLGAHVVAAGADDDSDIGDAGLRDARQHMGEHAAAGDPVENLRQGRLHSRAFASGEHDSESAALFRGRHARRRSFA